MFLPGSSILSSPDSELRESSTRQSRNAWRSRLRSLAAIALLCALGLFVASSLIASPEHRSTSGARYEPAPSTIGTGPAGQHC